MTQTPHDKSALPVWQGPPARDPYLSGSKLRPQLRQSFWSQVGMPHGQLPQISKKELLSKLQMWLKLFQYAEPSQTTIHTQSKCVTKPAILLHYHDRKLMFNWAFVQSGFSQIVTALSHLLTQLASTPSQIWRQFFPWPRLTWRLEPPNCRAPPFWSTHWSQTQWAASVATQTAEVTAGIEWSASLMLQQTK